MYKNCFIVKQVKFCEFCGKELIYHSTEYNVDGEEITEYYCEDEDCPNIYIVDDETNIEEAYNYAFVVKNIFIIHSKENDYVGGK